MKTTHYYRSSVLKRRPYLKDAWVEYVLQYPISTELQENGRIRFWAYIDALGQYLRVVVEPDGETVHNAFPDRGFE